MNNASNDDHATTTPDFSHIFGGVMYPHITKKILMFLGNPADVETLKKAVDQSLRESDSNSELYLAVQVILLCQRFEPLAKRVE